jgi:hypothetical protein
LMSTPSRLATGRKKMAGRQREPPGMRLSGPETKKCAEKL